MQLAPWFNVDRCPFLAIIARCRNFLASSAVYQCYCSVASLRHSGARRTEEGSSGSACVSAGGVAFVLVQDPVAGCNNGGLQASGLSGL